MLVLPRVCVSMHRIPRSSVHIPPRSSMIAVAVPCVCPSFCTRHACELTLAMALGHIISTYGVLLGIPCIISWNRHNMAPCHGLVKISAYIYPIRQYIRDNSLFSIQSFIKKYHTQVCFVFFVLDSLPFFFMRVALLLSWCNSSSTTAYPCPSMKYIDHSQWKVVV